jgi:hypothetical protein
MKLWLRLGDNAEYNEFDDLDSLRDFLLESGIDLEEIEPLDGGFTTPMFEGQNYVSLYWGDAGGEFEQDLNEDEWDYLLGKE